MCLNSQSEPIGVHALIQSPHLKWALVERRSGWLSLGSVRLACYLSTRWFWAGRMGQRITASPLFLSSLISRSIHCPMLILFASAAVWEWSSYKRGPVRLACSWHKDTVVNSPHEISQTVCSKVEPNAAVASFFSIGALTVMLTSWMSMWPVSMCSGSVVVVVVVEGRGVAATGRRAAVQFQTEPAPPLSQSWVCLLVLWVSLSPSVSRIHRKEEFVRRVSKRQPTE